MVRDLVKEQAILLYFLGWVGGVSFVYMYVLKTL